MVMQRLEPLFAAPLAVFELDGAAALNAPLLQEALARRKADPGLSRSNRRGWHSDDDFFRRSEPGAVALRGRIIDAVTRLTLQVSPGFDTARHALQAEGWINVLDRGGLNTPHDHPGWVWSGCYYVAVPEGDMDGSGEIEFLDPRTNLRTLTVEGAACFASKFKHKPRPGQFLVFPSWLKHWVMPNESESPRVSIAVNLRYVVVDPDAGDE